MSNRLSSEMNKSGQSCHNPGTKLCASKDFYCCDETTLPKINWGRKGLFGLCFHTIVRN